ncbi:MAG TPA: helix-turn-helix domain-containing protein [Gaiella sp.]
MAGSVKATEKRRQLVSAAAELFDREGYRATNVGRIAEAVGIRKRTLYHYVASKDQLLTCELPPGGSGAIRAERDACQRAVEDAIERGIASGDAGGDRSALTVGASSRVAVSAVIWLQRPATTMAT